MCDKSPPQLIETDQCGALPVAQRRILYTLSPSALVFLPVKYLNWRGGFLVRIPLSPYGFDKTYDPIRVGWVDVRRQITKGDFFALFPPAELIGYIVHGQGVGIDVPPPQRYSRRFDGAHEVLGLPLGNFELLIRGHQVSDSARAVGQLT